MEILLLFGKEEVPTRKPCWENAQDIKKSHAFLMAPSAHPRQKFCIVLGAWWQAIGKVTQRLAWSRALHANTHTHKYTSVTTLDAIRVWAGSFLICLHTARSPASALISQGENPGVPLPLKDTPTALPHLKHTDTHTARFDQR